MSKTTTHSLNSLKASEFGEYGQLAQQILGFYVPLALQIPAFRDDPELMETTIKATGESGITDVVTNADKIVQAKIKTQLPPEWQFWGEEGDDNVNSFDKTKKYMLIADPIEGTNNFLAGIDYQWGSVIALVDIETEKPIIGIVAHPTTGTFYLGIKGKGAYRLVCRESGQTVVAKMDATPEDGYNRFTYNNSPHFSAELVKSVHRFMAGGKVDEPATGINKLEKSRRTVRLPGPNKTEVVFDDLESGALEAVRYRGTVCFKTSNEMAAVFVVLSELGGIATDGDGNDWTLGINTPIAARTKEDWAYLKDVYDRAIHAKV